MAKEVSAQSVLQATAGVAKYGRVDSPVSAASQLKFKPFALPARTAHATVSARTMAEEKTISLTCSAATVGQTTDQFEEIDYHQLLMARIMQSLTLQL